MMEELSIWGPAIWMPESLTARTHGFIRSAYGLMLLATLAITLPQGRRFFISDRWGGYAKSGPVVDALHNPRAYPIVQTIWIACALMIAMGQFALWAALVNLALCRYFFVFMRWKGLLRGMGAPGFMSYWLAAVVFLLELGRHAGPDFSALVLLVSQVDYALIMLSSGIYKITAGYPRNYGMELGMVNPEWGYQWKFYKRKPTSHWMFMFLNQMAWSTQFVAAVCMLIPQLRFLGGCLMIGSFLFVMTQIRLGWLCHMVIIGGVLFFHPGSIGDQWIAAIAPAAPPLVTPEAAAFAAFVRGLEIALWTYLVLLPISFAGLYYNFYRRKRLPEPIQKALDRYTNFFGIIIWRVFSVDVVNFFPQIHRQSRSGGERTRVTDYGGLGLKRYNHVGESITVTSLFTSLKYYPSNDDIFHERLLRYAKTVECPESDILVFEYVSIQKIDDRFVFVPVAEYRVDPVAGSIEEKILRESSCIHSAHACSPVFEGAAPGSYAPAAK